VHRWGEELEELADAVFAYARERLRLDPVPLDGPRPLAELAAAAGQTVTPAGIGGKAALELFAEVLAPACISIDHPRYLAFVPCAPTKAAALFDLVVGASSIYAGSWLEGAGAVFAENEALAWLRDLAGLPPGAGGTFVQGGTLGNLSALVAARHAYRDAGGSRRARLAFVASDEAHASVAAAARVMDVEVLEAIPDEHGRLHGAAVAAAIDGRPRGTEVFAVVASAGATNLGVIDDLGSVADEASRRGLWLHVDAAYGGGALAAPSARARFAGIERADSVVIDPHKWLFAPFDCAALLYRRPELARAAHAQRADYLEAVERTGEWNPSDYAIQLTRRARGLPFWFSLATHGTDAYVAAIERTLEVARQAAAAIRERPELELLDEPELTVLCFRRHAWREADYYAWSERLRAAGTAFVTPTSHRGEPLARLVVVNPRTTLEDIELVLDTMR